MAVFLKHPPHTPVRHQQNGCLFKRLAGQTERTGAPTVLAGAGHIIGCRNCGQEIWESSIPSDPRGTMSGTVEHCGKGRSLYIYKTISVNRFPRHVSAELCLGCGLNGSVTEPLKTNGGSACILEFVNICTSFSLYLPLGFLWKQQSVECCRDDLFFFVD